MEILSLSGLNRLISAALSQAFPQPVWIEAEISRVYEKNGHFYLELVEKDKQQIKAKSSAVLWRNSSYILRQKLRGKFDDLIQVGIHVKILVDVDFHAIYGHKLVIRDLDPEFTLGQMELMRKRILKRLKKEGLLRENSLKPLPIVCQRVAVISSASAAGYKDFLNQLEHNTHNYSFHTQLFQASMQGTRLKKEVIEQLKNIQDEGNWDVICIVRGGGSRVDLAWFDDYDVAVAIAHCSIPIITGIGHEIDNSVADYVAHTQVKTPTAAAEFLIQHNYKYETDIHNLVFDIYQLTLANLDEKKKAIENDSQLLYHLATAQLEKENHNLQMYSAEVHNTTLHILEKENHLLEFYFHDFKNTVFLHLERQEKQLEQYQLILDSVSPQAILKKGYAIIKQSDKVVTRADKFKKNSSVSIQFYDSEIHINQ